MAPNFVFYLKNTHKVSRVSIISLNFKKKKKELKNTLTFSFGRKLLVLCEKHFKLEKF